MIEMILSFLLQYIQNTRKIFLLLMQIVRHDNKNWSLVKDKVRINKSIMLVKVKCFMARPRLTFIALSIIAGMKRMKVTLDLIIFTKRKIAFINEKATINIEQIKITQKI